MYLIVARNKIYGKGELISNLIMLPQDHDYTTVDNLWKELGAIKVMRELFDETIETDNLNESQLYLNYQSALQTGNGNDLFKILYKVREDLAVSLSEHIYLHHIAEVKINNEKIVPWECLDSKIYIADTWWETDEEILIDMNEMSFVEFMGKYKAY